jgi:glycosyltransferase involved in cell wall biosynthesis
VRSVVSHGVDGFLVRPGDRQDLAGRLQTLLADGGLRAAMGRRGRAKVEARYAWEAIIPRLEQVYEQVIAENAGVRAAA